jgi:hypothetical protein
MTSESVELTLKAYGIELSDMKNLAPAKEVTINSGE